MIGFLLFHFTFSAKIALIGFTPRVFSSPLINIKTQILKNSSSSEFDLILIESSSFNHQHENFHYICSFKEKIPAFDILFNPFHEKSTFSISDLVPGHLVISQNLYKHDFSVSYQNLNSSYFILPKSSQLKNNNHFISIDANSKEFSFLQNLETNFYLFAKNSKTEMENEELINLICSPKRKTTNFCFQIVFFSFLIFSIFMLLFFKSQNFIKSGRFQNFWLLDSQHNVKFGSPLQDLDELTRNFLIRLLDTSMLSKKTETSIIRIKRKKDFGIFQRAIVFPTKNNHAFAVLWEENAPLNNNDVKLDCKIKVPNDDSTPTANFTSFRDFQPLHISFILENSIHCTADFPMSFLAPFQPDSQLYTLVLSIYCDLNDMILTRPYLKSNFGTLFERFCKTTHIRRCFFYIKNKLYYAYNKEGLEHYDNNLIYQLPNKVPMENCFYYTANFLEGETQCFIHRICGLSFNVLFIGSVDQSIPKDPSFERCSIPFFTLVINYIFHLISANEMNLKFDRFIDLFKSSNNFSFVEIAIRTKRLITINTKLFNPVPTTLEELIKQIESEGIDDFQELRKEFLSLSPNSGFLKQKIIKIGKENPKFLSINAVLSHDEFMKDDILAIMAEDISNVKEKEQELEKAIPDIEKTIENLRMAKFHIDEHGEIIMDDDQVFLDLQIPLKNPAQIPEPHLSSESLNQSQINRQQNNPITTSLDDQINDSTNSRDRPITPQYDRKLKQLFDPSDLIKYSMLVRGNKVAFKLINGNHNQVWYSGVSNGEIGYIFDITSLSEVSNKRHISDESIQLTSSSSQIVFWIVDLKNDLVKPLFLQATIWDVLSVDRETRFTRLVEYLHNDDRNIFSQHYSLIKSGKIQQWSGELRLPRIGGAFEWHRFVMTISVNGTLHCLALNIHKQKEMENKLREIQKVRDLLLSSGRLSLWQFTNDYQPLERMKRFDPGLMNVVSMNWAFINEQVRPDYRTLFISKMRRAFSMNESVKMDLPLLLDNQEIWVSIRGKLRGNSQTSSQTIVGVCIDITQLRNTYSDLEKEKKRAEEANKQKTIFLANMSHEIRTPMNGIFGILDILALQELTSEQRLLVDSIRTSSFQLLKLLDNTLNLSKIEQGELEVNPTIFSIQKLIEPICFATALRAAQNKLDFKVSTSRNFPSFLYGDSNLFMQICNNLTSNALKFTKQGLISVKLGWEEQPQEEKLHDKLTEELLDDQQQEFCVLEVEDTGIGISKEQQRIIFERFAQADPSVQRFFGGTGLGLSLVQDLVDLMGGTVSVESSVGRGTKFTVKLPMQSVMACYSPQFCDNKEHIIMLMIEDRALSYSILEWMQKRHYSIICFTDPNQLKELLCESNTMNLTLMNDESVHTNNFSNNQSSNLHSSSNENDNSLDKMKLESNGLTKIVDLIFVEGFKEKWLDIKNILETRDNPPPVCNFINAGEKSFFELSLTKPIIMHHFIDFINRVRYGKMKDNDSSSNLNISSTTTLTQQEKPNTVQSQRNRVKIISDVPKSPIMNSFNVIEQLHSNQRDTTRANILKNIQSPSHNHNKTESTEIQTKDPSQNRLLKNSSKSEKKTHQDELKPKESPNNTENTHPTDNNESKTSKEKKFEKNDRKDEQKIEKKDEKKETRILVVEDNKANQFVMQKILSHIGCFFKIAENGREAISALDTENFDLIFMDCQMPVLDGLEATRIIRSSGKEYSTIPIVALTASAVEGDEKTCRQAGMDAYLAKPVRIQQITNAIKQFVNQ
ncbi:hypothetical protein TRFO_13996 [Tritrichomonas foetus]|uniref:ATPase n=1 Tax=Tritrichomonas foetus TaxID=1144522 RepID=A0A1J4L0Y7_9EUKA|nr:hypothetical protein TRFO_13996 [Tritrichomonas foetus]|eukprot:OHT15630.1 hypothetical protein TRFO_13996 [Tritrichomonas foetus]